MWNNNKMYYLLKFIKKKKKTNSININIYKQLEKCAIIIKCMIL